LKNSGDKYEAERQQRYKEIHVGQREE